MHNFSPHLICVATLLQNTLSIEQAHCFPLGGWLALKRTWMMRPTDGRQIPYFLKFQITDCCVCGACALLTVHDVTNKITFSTVHRQPLPGHLSAEPQPQVTFAASKTLQKCKCNSLPSIFFSNLCAVYPLSRQICNQNTIHWMAY